MARVPEAGRVQDRPRCMGVTIAGSRYALLLDHVQEVIAPRTLARVFHAPALVAGIMSLRGEVLPVLEPALMLGGRASLDLQAGRVVVVREHAAGGRRAGLRVDELSDLRELPTEGLAAVPTTFPASIAGLLLGIISEAPPCAVLDVRALLDAPELRTLAGLPA